MERRGYEDLFDSKAIGEQLSDLNLDDDFIKGTTAEMRGFYGGRTEQDVFPSTADHPSRPDTADNSSPDHPDGDLPNGLA